MDYRKEGGNGIRPRNASSGLSTAELFLGVKQSAKDPIVSNGVELDENDVVWAVDHEETTKEPKVISGFSALSMSNGIDSNGNTNNNNHNNTNKNNNIRSSRRLGIEPLTPGLSAALGDDRRSNLNRKPLANFRYTATKTAAASVSRMIPSIGVNSSSEERSGSRKYHQSAPVNVPLWSKANQGPGLRKPKFTDLTSAVDDDNDDDEKDEERLPPHELLARDHARTHMTTFSVCEGLGRTLKGRDLSRVRNSVWRQTDLSVRWCIGLVLEKRKCEISSQFPFDNTFVGSVDDEDDFIGEGKCTAMNMSRRPAFRTLAGFSICNHLTAIPST